MMPLKSILKNKLLLQKQYHLQEIAIDSWPYWMFEENIKIVNELTEEEEKERKKQDKEQKVPGMNFNPNSMMNNMNSMASKFKS
jgi:ABC-type proline/glycine betaine transport system ATPase subunit